jgi:hypothetical protein
MFLVARGGIEPPTQGFSILRSIEKRHYRFFEQFPLLTMKNVLVVTKKRNSMSSDVIQ